MYYTTCPHCGAHLDPGERCDCQDHPENEDQERSNPNMNDYLAASNATSLLDMANGAIKERIDYEMGRVMQNISDPNTKASAKREITLKITLAPDEDRKHIEVSCTASSKLAAMNPVKTSLATGRENGQTVAVELTPQIPGQLDTTGNVTPVRKLLKFGEAAV